MVLALGFPLLLLRVPLDHSGLAVRGITLFIDSDHPYIEHGAYGVVPGTYREDCPYPYP